MASGSSDIFRGQAAASLARAEQPLLRTLQEKQRFLLPSAAAEVPAHPLPLHVDLTAVGGISDALSSLLDFFEDNSKADASIASADAVSAALVLDAIPAFIGDDDGSAERMKALGCSETRVIENLDKLLNLLLMVAALPPEPSYSTTAIRLVKVLMVLQKMMRYNDSELKSSCDENIKSFGNIGTCWTLVDVLKKYLQMRVQGQPGPAQLRRGGDPALLVLTECCKAIRSICITTTDNAADNRTTYGAIPGSMEVLVGVLKAHGCSNAAVAQACCGAIRNVCFEDAVSIIKYSAVEGSMDALVDVLQVHGRLNPAVAEQACWAISVLTTTNGANRVKYGAVQGSMRVLAGVLRFHCDSDAAVTEACCDAIGDVNCGNSENAKEFAAEEGSLSGLVDTLWEHGCSNAAVARTCCRAIRYTNAQNEEVIKDYCGMPGSIEILVNVLKAHGTSDATVAEQCCMALGSLVEDALLSDEEFLSTDVFSAIVDVLKAHGKVDKLATKAAVDQSCYLIGCLCNGEAAYVSRFNALDTIHVLEDEVTVPVSSKTFALRALGEEYTWRAHRTHARICVEVVQAVLASILLLLVVCFLFLFLALLLVDPPLLM